MCGEGPGAGERYWQNSLAESTQKSLVLQVEAQYSCRGRLWALTTGSSRRAVRESCRTLTMVLPSHYLWLLLPALESQSPLATIHTELKGRKDSTPCPLQQGSHSRLPALVNP